ncbi:hypothetical protein AWC32_16785 [Mycobacterium xenopi]|nr:hypothetical protein AWC32_16785 [Mycobacterium xenopi]
MEAAASRYYHAINAVLANDQAAAVRAWGARRERTLAWLEVLNAGDDLDQGASALAAVPAAPSEYHRDRATTVFGEIDYLAEWEARVNRDRGKLQRTIITYIGAVDTLIARVADVLHSCNDGAKQVQCAESVAELIDNYAIRISNIQRLYAAQPGAAL